MRRLFEGKASVQEAQDAVAPLDELTAEEDEKERR
jgi:hypothetical protein